jgi:hypothetical protein
MPISVAADEAAAAGEELDDEACAVAKVLPKSAEVAEMIARLKNIAE